MAPIENLNSSRATVSGNGSNGVHHAGSNGNGYVSNVSNGASVAGRPGPEKQDLALSDLGPLLQVFMAILRARWWAGAVAALIVGGGLGWVLFHNPPEYTAETTFLAQSTLDQILDPNASQTPASGAGAEPTIDENSLKNHLSVMLSHKFRQQLIASLSPAEALQVQKPYLKPGQQPSSDFIDEILEKRIEVDREKGREFFTIDVRHRDQDTALFLADRFVNQYIAYVQDEFSKAGVEATKLLQAQADHLSVVIRQIEDKRRGYRKDFNLITVEENQGILVEELKRINAALSDVRLLRARLDIQVRQAKEDLAKSDMPFNNPVLAAYGNNQLLRQQLDSLRAARDLQATRYGPNHPKMRDSEENYQSAREILAASFQLAAADLKAQLDIAIASEKQISAELDAAFRQSLDLDRLAGDFNALGDLLSAQQKTQADLLLRIARASLGAQLPIGAMQVVDEAFIRQPALPKAILFGIGILILSVGAFISAPIVLYVFDEKIKGSMDLEAALKKDLLGAIPRLSRTRPEDRSHVVRNNVDFVQVESFLTVAGQIDLISKKPYPKRLLITSTLPSEGKSMLASNLAATYTRLGRKTLLVDCDFRRPVQHQVHEHSDKVGGVLTWLLSGAPFPEELFNTDSALGLMKLADGTYFIPAGGVEAQPSRLLISSSMNEFFERIGKLFDVVIVDSPPIGLFQDGLVLAKYCHETVFVVREGKAHTAQVKRVLSDLEKTPAPATGIVLNGFSPKTSHPQLAYRNLTESYGQKYGYGKKAKKPKPASK